MTLTLSLGKYNQQNNNEKWKSREEDNFKITLSLVAFNKLSLEVTYKTYVGIVTGLPQRYCRFSCETGNITIK